MNVLKQLNKRVDQLQKQYPNAKRTNLMKQAGKEYRAAKNKKPAKKKRKVGAYKVVERNEPRSTPARKVYRQVRTRKGNFTGMKKINGIGAAKAKIRTDAKNKLAGKLLLRDLAKTKRDKRRYTKDIQRLRKDVKRYS